ncbi:MAG: DUF3392 family protein [Planctomycetes bacterium]|nr:DUF3392 family protein [Planctomycetota bacterium]
MDILNQIASMITEWVSYFNSTQIATAITLTLLAIYGNDINRTVMNVVKGKNIAVRTLTFILLCTFGYGLLTVSCLPLISKGLNFFGRIYYGPLTVLCFIFLGYLGSRKKQI